MPQKNSTRKKPRKNRIRVLLITTLCAVIIVGGLAHYVFVLHHPPFQKGLTLYQNYQNFANPYVRYVSIAAGMRKEQIANQFAKTLEWNEDDIHQFISVKTAMEEKLKINEGYYFPETYIIPIDGGGEEIANIMADRFSKEIIKQYAESPENIRNLDVTLKIASLIQREAAGKHDMKLISGIIWNRIFSEMPLQIDATVQYAKGTEGNWWPQVSLDDVIETKSPYNTYHIDGLPPTPISNPGIAAIDAAFNPQKTSCLFYFHDKNSVIHCSKTGEEHVRKVKLYLQ